MPLTITDPNMTRLLMSLEDAVELVIYAFQHAESGDIMVQKAPASTIGDLAQAVKQLFNYTKEDKIIGTRHGEKLYESLLTKEEFIAAEDMGAYYRIPADKRDLNYDKYFVEGNIEVQKIQDYNSKNTEILDVAGIKKALLKLDYIQDELKAWNAK